MAAYDRTTQDVGNMLSFDHLNLTIADQQTAMLFYIVGLGLTRDPYMTVGLENMWINIGRQQFHLPTRSESQVVRGHIGLVVPDLGALEERLKAVAPRLAGTTFAYSVEDGFVDVTCPWGNRFRCRAPGDQFGGTRLGMQYIDFNVPVGAAAGIAHFYQALLGVPAVVDSADGRPAAVVRAGRGQSLVFRESPEEPLAHDGYHIAVYLADFSEPHAALDSRGLITEESNDCQYRFTRIIDLENGNLLYELEHEVRSMHHSMFQRPLVNREPSLTNQTYSRGSDALVIG